MVGGGGDGGGGEGGSGGGGGKVGGGGDGGAGKAQTEMVTTPYVISFHAIGDTPTTGGCPPHPP